MTMRILLGTIAPIAVLYASAATADEYKRGFSEGWSAGYAAGRKGPGGGGGGGGGTNAEHHTVDISNGVVGGGGVSREIERALNSQRPSAMGIIQYESDGRLVSVPLAVPLFGTFDANNSESAARVHDFAVDVVGEQDGMSINIFTLKSGEAVKDAQAVTIMDDRTIGASPQWERVIKDIDALTIAQEPIMSFD